MIVKLIIASFALFWCVFVYFSYTVHGKFVYTSELAKEVFFMKKKTVRVATNQPGVYKNQRTGKYDIKYHYRSYDPLTGEKTYEQEWTYGIHSYTEAVKLLSRKKVRQAKINGTACTLQEAYEVWEEKAVANNFSPVTIRNTKSQLSMIKRFWSLDLPIVCITERMYLQLITNCRKYGYSEETIYNINGCLRKLITIAYKNRYIDENPIDYWDSPRIDSSPNRYIISYNDFRKLDDYFRTNSFVRLGENHYPRYRFLFNLLYYTGMRIGEAIALRYSDFITARGKIGEDEARMRVSVTRSYNSEYKLLKTTKNRKSREIPLPSEVEELFRKLRREHRRNGGSLEDRIFPWDHGACALMLKNACRNAEIKHYSCHDFRHTYISNLIRSGVPITVIEAVSGDTQATIFKRYSHMFAGDEAMVLKALESVKKEKDSINPGRPDGCNNTECNRM